MESRYLRNLPALSRDECIRLRQKHVLIVGCGGLGGHILDQLLRIGVGHIRICDGDVFEPTNLNRQLLAELPLLGEKKTHAAVLRGRRVNPNVTVEAVDAYLTQENVFDLLHQCDVVLDALDNIECRKILSSACTQAGIPYIFGAVSGWIAQAAVCAPGEHLIDVLYSDGGAIQDKSVLSFTPALCASIQSALCIKLLLDHPVDTGKLYYFDLLNQEFETIPIAKN